MCFCELTLREKSICFAWNVIFFCRKNESERQFYVLVKTVSPYLSVLVKNCKAIASAPLFLLYSPLLSLLFLL